MLLGNRPTLTNFLNAPLVYSNAFRFQIAQLFPTTFEVAIAKGRSVSFRVSSKVDKVFENIELLEMRPISSHTISHELNRDLARFYYVEHAFATNGKYVVHLLKGNNFTITYAVEVI